MVLHRQKELRTLEISQTRTRCHKRQDQSRKPQRHLRHDRDDDGKSPPHQAQYTCRATHWKLTVIWRFKRQRWADRSLLPPLIAKKSLSCQTRATLIIIDLIPICAVEYVTPAVLEGGIIFVRIRLETGNIWSIKIDNNNITTNVCLVHLTNGIFHLPLPTQRKSSLLQCSKNDCHWNQKLF